MKVRPEVKKITEVLRYSIENECFGVDYMIDHIGRILSYDKISLISDHYRLFLSVDGGLTHNIFFVNLYTNTYEETSHAFSKYMKEDIHLTYQESAYMRMNVLPLIDMLRL